MATITYSDTLVSTNCVACGIVFAVPEDWLANSRNNHRDFWCPNGCRLSFRGETEAEKLAKQLASTRANLDQAEMATRDKQRQVESAQRQEALARKETERVKRRAKAACCPCCNRTFVQLRKHMAAKHPEFVPTKKYPKVRGDA